MAINVGKWISQIINRLVGYDPVWGGMYGNRTTNYLLAWKLLLIHLTCVLLIMWCDFCNRWLLTDWIIRCVKTWREWRRLDYTEVCVTTGVSELEDNTQRPPDVADVLSVCPRRNKSALPVTCHYFMLCFIMQLWRMWYWLFSSSALPLFNIWWIDLMNAHSLLTNKILSVELEIELSFCYSI